MTWYSGTHKVGVQITESYLCWTQERTQDNSGKWAHPHSTWSRHIPSLIYSEGPSTQDRQAEPFGIPSVHWRHGINHPGTLWLGLHHHYNHEGSHPTLSGRDPVQSLRRSPRGEKIPHSHYLRVASSPNEIRTAVLSVLYVKLHPKIWGWHRV